MRVPIKYNAYYFDNRRMAPLGQLDTVTYAHQSEAESINYPQGMPGYIVGNIATASVSRTQPPHHKHGPRDLKIFTDIRRRLVKNSRPANSITRVRLLDGPRSRYWAPRSQHTFEAQDWTDWKDRHWWETIRTDDRWDQRAARSRNVILCRRRTGKRRNR